jgi:hypothetical protein
VWVSWEYFKCGVGPLLIVFLVKYAYKKDIFPIEKYLNVYI